MKYTIREMTAQEYPLLVDFLYEAIFVPDRVEPPSTAPELQVCVKGFGTSKDDFALVAEIENKIIGAVRVRIMNNYRHIDDKTPSLAISLYKRYRGQGIGGNLIKEMLSLLQTHGYKRVSLSVQKANYAVKLYKKIEFRIIKEIGYEWIMTYNLWISERT